MCLFSGEAWTDSKTLVGQAALGLQGYSVELDRLLFNKAVDSLHRTGHGKVLPLNRLVPIPAQTVTLAP